MPGFAGDLREAMREVHRENCRREAACASPVVGRAGPIDGTEQPSRREWRALYVDIFGVEPPATIEEWKAETMKSLGCIPPYAQALIDKWESAGNT